MKKTAQEIRILRKELQKTRQLEAKVLAKEIRGRGGFGITDKIREKIPEKAMTSLEVAFEKGFTLIFTKGDSLIDKMGIEKARRQYEIYADSLDKMIYEETLKAVDKAAGSRSALTKGITTAEGSGLGIFGLGLPDIPIFLAMLLKTSYEIAAAYGIDFRDEREKRYTLALFNTIFSEGHDKEAFSEECDEIGEAIDNWGDIDTEIRQEDHAQALGKHLFLKYVRSDQVRVVAVKGIKLGKAPVPEIKTSVLDCQTADQDAVPREVLRG